MRLLFVGGLLNAFLTLPTSAGILDRGPTRVMCHRTANRDIPENTVESLAFAARMGCSVVEVDVRVTLDHQIVLNHDGLLERLTDGMGEIETRSFDELAMLDAGSWMNNRFHGFRIPRFWEALRFARDNGIGLVLDLKDKGMGAMLLTELRREGMLDRVRFGGEWSDVHDTYSAANEDSTAGVEPSVTAASVQELHGRGKVVIANFSANGHEMDLSGMRSAVAAGVDWINVDYPRLGADAIGKPVEGKIGDLVTKAEGADKFERLAAISELTHYDGFPLQSAFERWLRNDDDGVSRAAAVALLTIRPATPTPVFTAALSANVLSARKNSAWALGMRAAPVTESLIHLLNEKDGELLQETLLALSRCPGVVPASRIAPFLTNPNPLIRGAAALALARHQPEAAAEIIPQALAAEESSIAKDYAVYVGKGKPRMSQSEIDITVGRYRGLMKMIESGTLLHDANAFKLFEREAFRSAADYSSTVGPVAGFQLWDRISADPDAAIRALESNDIEVANRAEWILTKAGPPVLIAVRKALHSDSKAVRERAIRILAFQEDEHCVSDLRLLGASKDADPALVDWAIEKIQTFTLSMHRAK